MAENVIFESQLIQFDSYIAEMGGYVYQITPAPFTLEVDKNYVIVWDGEEYPSVAIPYDSFAPGAVTIGTGEAPAVVGYLASTDYIGIITAMSGEHTVGIYQATEEPEQVGIVIKNRLGDDVTYYGVETVTFDTNVEGQQQTFTKGNVFDGLEIELDLENGDQVVTAPEGYLVKEAVIKKPETLTPENIVKDIEIAGVTGTFEGGGGENFEADIIAGTLSGDYYNPSVLRVASYKFSGMKSLTGVSFPACKLIDWSAFAWCNNITTVSFPNCEAINTCAFYHCEALKEAVFPKCSIIQGSGFTGCYELSKADFPLCETFSSYAFAYCSKLSSINFPILKNASTNAFNGNHSLTAVDLPKCENIGMQTFYYCSRLSEINAPLCTYIGNSAFQSCIALISANFPNCTSVGSTAFSSCSALTTAIFPECTSLGSNVFRGSCKSLKTVYFPKLTVVPYQTFSGCNAINSANFEAAVTAESGAFWNINGWTSLPSTVFPNLRTIGSSAFAVNYYITNVYLPKALTLSTRAFYQCTRLETVSLPACSSIYSSAFMNCSALASLYLLGSSYVSLQATNVFSSTPLSTSSYLGKWGSIFVRESMLASYKTRSYWSYYSNRFVGLTDDEITALEVT